MTLNSITFEFILLQISVAFSPGLIIALVVNESVQKNRISGIKVAIGAAFGALIITFLSAILVSYLFSSIPTILTFIYLGGTFYIVFKGLKTFKTSPLNLSLNSSEHLIYSGFKLNLSNPKMWVFFLTVLPIFVANKAQIFIELVYFGIITVFINLFADVSYAIFSNYFFKDASTNIKLLINKISGISLIAIGVYLFFSRFI